MNPFIKGILQGSGTGLSSKRVVMFIFVAAFIATVIANLCKKTLLLDSTVRDQLYYAMLTAISLVFGEGAISMIKGTAEKTGVNKLGLPDKPEDQGK